jgi:hypothetical protein
VIVFNWFERVWSWIEEVAEEHRIELLYALFGLLAAVVRASGRTVLTGTTGLKFSFGRARGLCPPGFYPLIPSSRSCASCPRGHGPSTCRPSR